VEKHRDPCLSRHTFLQIATAAGFTVAISLLEACTRSTITPASTESSQAIPTPVFGTRTAPPMAAPITAIVIPVTTSPVAAAYVQEALDYIEQNSVMRDRVDWPHLRDDATTLTHDAQTTTDTYPAIRSVLQQLNDRHSSFFTSAQWQTLQQASASGLGFINEGRVVVVVFPGSPAAQAGMQVRDVITAVNGTPVESVPAIQLSSLANTSTGGAILMLQREGETTPITVTLAAAVFATDRLPQSRALTTDIGYLELPSV